MNLLSVNNTSENSEIYFSSEKSKKIELADGKIKAKSAESNEGYGLRVVRGGKIGFSYYAEGNDKANAVKNATSIAKCSKKTGFEFPKNGKYPLVRSYSKKVTELSAEELMEMTMQMEGVLRKNGQRGRVMIEATNSEANIENTNGLYAKSEHTNFTAYCEAMKKDGFGFSYYSGVELMENPVALAEEASGMCESMIGAKKLGSGKYCVVFSPEAIAGMLDILLPSLSGDWKRKGISKIAGMHGKKIVSEQFSIYEDATINGSRTSSFDGEGVPSRRIPLIERGILKNFIYDRETAALEGVRNEGCCSRISYQSKPHASVSNLEITAGTWNSFETELKEFVLVKSIHGVHTSNMTTGDFGVEANIAFRISNGKKQATRGFIISGNIFTMLNNILGMEKMQKTYDSIISPSIAIENLQIIG